MTSRSAGGFGRPPGEERGLPLAAAIQWRQVEPGSAVDEASDDSWSARRAADRDHRGEGADTVAGSEFVDDRIRLSD